MTLFVLSCLLEMKLSSTSPPHLDPSNSHLGPWRYQKSMRSNFLMLSHFRLPWDPYSYSPEDNMLDFFFQTLKKWAQEKRVDFKNKVKNTICTVIHSDNLQWGRLVVVAGFSGLCWKSYLTCRFWAVIVRNGGHALHVSSCHFLALKLQLPWFVTSTFGVLLSQRLLEFGEILYITVYVCINLYNYNVISMLK